MSAGAIRAGQAYVELATRDKPLTSGLDRAATRLKAFGAAVTSMGATLVAMGLAIAAPLALAVKMAAEAAETTSKFEAVCGDQAQAATAFVDAFAAAVGRSRVEAMQGLAAFQAMFSGLGYGGEQARQMSEQMQGLAVDFASFHNISDAEATQRFISALAGSSQVLDMFGISIREASLDQAFLAMGMRVNTQTATEQQKVMARLHVIQTSMNRQNATGDAIRTAGSLSNQWKRLRGVFLDTAVAVGNALTPILQQVVGVVTACVQVVGNFISINSGLVVVIGAVAAGLTTAGVALMMLGPAISAVGVAISTVSGALKFMGATVGAILSPIGLIVGAIGGAAFAFLRFTNQGQNAVEHLHTGLASLGDILGTMGGGISDALAVGDLQGAFDIAMLGMRTAWAQIVITLRSTWLEFVDWFKGTWMGDVWNSISSVFRRIVAHIGAVVNALRELPGVEAETARQERLERELIRQSVFARVRNFDRTGNQAILQHSDMLHFDRFREWYVDEHGINQVRPNLEAIRREMNLDPRNLVGTPNGPELNPAPPPTGPTPTPSVKDDPDLARMRQDLARLRGEMDFAAAELSTARIVAGLENTQAATRVMPTPMAAQVERDADKIDAKGTFSAFAVRGLALADSLAKRTAEAAERTATNTANIAGQMQNLGSVPVV